MFDSSTTPKQVPSMNLIFDALSKTSSQAKANFDIALSHPAF
jgi:hypothetical protein